MRSLGPICIALGLTALAACSQPTPTERIAKAQHWLGKGKSDAALTEFRKARAELDPTSAECFEARMGEIEALIPSKPGQASYQCVKLAKEQPERFGEEQFRHIAGLLISAKEYCAAIDLIDAGMVRFGKEPWRELLEPVARDVGPETLRSTSCCDF